MSKKASFINLRIPVPILSALLGIIGVIVGAIIGQDLIINFILSQTSVNISASHEWSGVSSGPYLQNFGKTTVALGETSYNKSVRTFLSFYVGNIPVDAEITESTLMFRCKLIGAPSPFGRIWVRQFDFRQYSSEDFSELENTTMWKESFDSATVFEKCKWPGAFSISSNSLKQVIQKAVQTSDDFPYFQMGMLFENLESTPNYSQDAIIFTKVPVLKVTYKKP